MYVCKPPASKGFTIGTAGYETWFTRATLIEIGVYRLTRGRGHSFSFNKFFKQTFKTTCIVILFYPPYHPPTFESRGLSVE